MTRETIRIKFYDNREDIVRRSDCLSIYDTTEGNTIIMMTGYADLTVPTHIIKSISIEYIHDKWIRVNGGKYKYKCPKCACYTQHIYNFCPTCGKGMK